MVLDKQQALTAQTAIIGSILIDPSLTGQILSKVQAGDFMDASYRTVFEIIQQLFAEGKPVDAVMVKSRLGNAYTDLLLECMELTATTSNWPSYADLLREESRLAKLRGYCMALMECITLDDAQEVMAKANDLFCQSKSRRVISLAQGYDDFLQRMKTPVEYLKWGFPTLDKILYTEAGDLIVLGGRPSAGKTALALGMAHNLSGYKRVGFFSLETNDKKLIDRFMAYVASVDFNRIKRHSLTGIDNVLIKQQHENILRCKLDIVDAAGMSVQDIRATSLSRRYEVIFVDYLQMIRSSGIGRTEEVARISMGLHTFAQQNNITVVALSQLKRVDGGEITLESLRESGQIEQDADAALLLYLADENIPNGPRILKIAKNKEGKRGKFTLDFDGQHQTFTEPGAKDNSPIQQEFVEITGQEVPFEG